MSAMYKIVEEPMPIPEDGPSPALKDFLAQCFVKHPAQRPTAAKLLTHAWVRTLLEVLTRLTCAIL